MLLEDILLSFKKNSSIESRDTGIHRVLIAYLKTKMASTRSAFVISNYDPSVSSAEAGSSKFKVTYSVQDPLELVGKTMWPTSASLMYNIPNIRGSEIPDQYTHGLSCPYKNNTYSIIDPTDRSVEYTIQPGLYTVSRLVKEMDAVLRRAYAGEILYNEAHNKVVIKMYRKWKLILPWESPSFILGYRRASVIDQNKAPIVLNGAVNESITTFIAPYVASQTDGITTLNLWTDSLVAGLQGVAEPPTGKALLASVPIAHCQPRKMCSYLWRKEYAQPVLIRSSVKSVTIEVLNDYNRPVDLRGSDLNVYFGVTE